MRSYLEFCSDQQLQDMWKSINATEDSIRHDVKTLIEWLEKHPYLPKIKDADILTNYLLRSENSLEKAKNWLDIHYTARAEMPEVFENRRLNSEEVAKLNNFGSYVPMPKLTPDCYRVVIFHCPSTVKKDFFPTSEVLLKGSQLALDLSMKTDKIRGMIVIYDFENMGLSHVSTLFPILKKMLTLQTELNPVNFHKIYLVNLLSLAEPLVNYSKTVIVKDLAKKIEIWKKSSTELPEIIPAECLPSDFGGNEKSIDELASAWFEYLLSYSDWFEAEEKFKADLNKKPASDKQNPALDGVSGSFRKLCVD